MKPSSRFRRNSAKTVLGLIGAILLAGVPAGRAADLPRERIVYATFRPANTEIYLFDAPGKMPRRLTTDPALDYNPVFSLDGQWLVFCSERRGNPDLGRHAAIAQCVRRS